MGEKAIARVSGLTQGRYQKPGFFAEILHIEAEPLYSRSQVEPGNEIRWAAASRGARFEFA